MGKDLADAIDALFESLKARQKERNQERLDESKDLEERLVDILDGYDIDVSLAALTVVTGDIIKSNIPRAYRKKAIYQLLNGVMNIAFQSDGESLEDIIKTISSVANFILKDRGDD